MIKRTVCFILLLVMLSASTNGAADLTQTEIQRLTKATALLMGAEDRSLENIIREFEKTGFPREQLLVYEAVAATFRDIQQEYGHDGLEAQAQLLGKIRMNMAYFQLGGPAGESRGMGELNRLIRRKLKQYLPEDIWDDPKLFHSLE